MTKIYESHLNEAALCILSGDPCDWEDGRAHLSQHQHLRRPSPSRLLWERIIDSDVYADQLSRVLQQRGGRHV